MFLVPVRLISSASAGRSGLKQAFSVSRAGQAHFFGQRWPKWIETGTALAVWCSNPISPASVPKIKVRVGAPKRNRGLRKSVCLAAPPRCTHRGISDDDEQIRPIRVRESRLTCMTARWLSCRFGCRRPVMRRKPVLCESLPVVTSTRDSPIANAQRTESGAP